MSSALVPADPTPSPVQAVFQPYGPSSVGTPGSSLYVRAGLADVSHPGWSWSTTQHQAPAPFCHGNTCYNVTDLCLEYGGVPLADPICAFPPNTVQVAGVTCWQDDCFGDMMDRQTCEQVFNGKFIGGEKSDVWCVTGEDVTVVGPACWGSDCFTAELATACETMQGSIFGDIYCIIPSSYTVAGPLCDVDGTCFTGFVKDACASLNGVSIADRWCMLEGCDFTVLGPVCERGAESPADCYNEELGELCTELGGIANIANRYCILRGTQYSLVGPISYAGIGSAGDGDRLCRFFGGRDIRGRYCLKEGTYASLGPTCLGEECFLNETASFCSQIGGVTSSDFFCAVKDHVVSFPNCWNQDCFQGPSEYCSEHMCAVPFAGDDVKPRCEISSVPPPVTPSLPITRMPMEPTLFTPPVVPTSTPSQSPTSTSGVRESARYISWWVVYALASMFGKYM